jgi:hypothetical protein
MIELIGDIFVLGDVLYERRTHQSIEGCAAREAGDLLREKRS